MTFYNVVFHDSLSIKNIVEWFVDEVINPEKKRFSVLRTLKKILRRHRKMKKNIETLLFVDFVRKNYLLIRLEINVT